MVYTIIAQRWPPVSNVFYGQLERVDPSKRSVTVFKCLHFHRKPEKARTCPDVVAAKERDRRRAQSGGDVVGHPLDGDLSMNNGQISLLQVGDLVEYRGQIRTVERVSDATPQLVIYLDGRERVDDPFELNVTRQPYCTHPEPCFGAWACQDAPHSGAL